MPLIADDSSQATALANTLQLAQQSLVGAQNNTALQLPTGTIHLGYHDANKVPILLDERHSGLTIQGNGRNATLLVNRQDYAPLLILRSTRVPQFSEASYTAGNSSMTVTASQGFATYNPHDVLYFWHTNSRPDRSLRQLLTVTTTSGTSTVNLSGAISTTIGVDIFTHIINGAQVSGASPAGTTDFELKFTAQASLFDVDADVFVSDGPGAMLCVGEWARVKSRTNVGGVTTVVLDRPVVRSYEDDLTCLVPAPHMTDITIRDLAIAVSTYEGSQAFGYAEFGTRLRFENVDFVQGPPDGATPLGFGYNGAGDVTLLNLTSAGFFAFNVCSQVTAVAIRATGIVAEEFCIDMFFSQLLLHGAGGFRISNSALYAGAVPCTRIYLSDSVINGAADGYISAVDDSTFTNVEILNYGGSTLYANADRCTWINVRSDVQIRFRGQDWRIGLLTAPQIDIEDYSSSLLTTGMLQTPLLPDPTAVTFTLAEPKQFGLQFLAFSDGNIASANTESAVDGPRTIVAKLPIFDEETGDLIGYIPIYENFT